MAEPVVDDVAFPNGLHPGKGKTDSGTITGTGFQKGDVIKVMGHSGKKPTVWIGTVGDPTGAAKTWAFTVSVKHVKQRQKDEKGRDAEDVSTTVTNPTNGESQPVINPGVTLVP